MCLARESTNQGLACKYTHTWLTPINLPSPPFIMHRPCIRVHRSGTKTLYIQREACREKIEPLLAPSLQVSSSSSGCHAYTVQRRRASSSSIVFGMSHDEGVWPRSVACYTCGGSVCLVSVGLDASSSPRWYPNVIELFCFVRKKMCLWSGFASLVDS
jgi:hypothetical protein